MEQIEQLKQRILNKTKEICNLAIEVNTLKEELIKLSPFQIGDKVEVDQGREYSRSNQIQIVYINQISLDSELRFEYKFSKPKKDGSYGEQGTGIYHYAGDKKFKITKL